MSGRATLLPTNAMNRWGEELTFMHCGESGSPTDMNLTSCGETSTARKMQCQEEIPHSDVPYTRSWQWKMLAASFNIYFTRTSDWSAPPRRRLPTGSSSESSSDRFLFYSNGACVTLALGRAAGAACCCTQFSHFATTRWQKSSMFHFNNLTSIINKTEKSKKTIENIVKDMRN